MTAHTDDAAHGNGAVQAAAQGVVDDPAEVTPQWLTAVLQAGGTDVDVRDLWFEAIGSGQLGASYRFHLMVRPEHAAAAPRSVVVKMAAGSAAAREQIAVGYRSEVGFYQRFASATLLRIPRCWSAAISDDGQRFTLVLEDAHPALPGRQVDGCTVAQATAALRNLAGLHAPFWNKTGLDDEVGWLRRTDEAGLAFLGQIMVGATAEFVERYRDDLPPGDADTMRRVADAFPHWGRHVSSPHSLIHGDYRLDNLLFDGDSEVTAVDWQSLEIGFPGRDLAYFLSLALSTADRRAHESSLVAAYHRQLVDHGVADYSVEQCFQDYRLGTLQGPLLTVLGCLYATGKRTPSSDAMFLSMAGNACATIRDLETLDLLSAQK